MLPPEVCQRTSPGRYQSNALPTAKLVIARLMLYPDGPDVVPPAHGQKQRLPRGEVDGVPLHAVEARREARVERLGVDAVVHPALRPQEALLRRRREHEALGAE